MKLKTLFAAAAAVLLAGCLGDTTGSRTINIDPPPALPAGADTVTAGNGLKYAEISVGTGTVAASGSNVAVHYTGWLLNGTGFDTSVGGPPITLKLGAGVFLSGFEQGIVGMKVGGKRRLIIPPSLGYGSNEIRDQGSGQVVIPANSTLIFDVTLTAVAN